MSPVRFVVRAELRGKKEIFALATAAMGFATAVLALVLSLADSFEESFSSSARELLGGDVAIRLTQREFSDEETQWMRDNSIGYSLMRAARMLATAGENQPVIARLKSVDDAYPLFGDFIVEGGGDMQSIIQSEAVGGAYPAIVSRNLMEQLSITVGANFAAGGMPLYAAAVVEAEPDPDPTLLLNALLILVHEKHLLAAQVVQPGMLVSRYARVKLPPQTTSEQWREKLEQKYPEGGWRVRGKDDALPRLQHIIEDMRAFLALASLAAMLIAGVGIGGAMNAFLSARLRAIAVVKMLGGNAQLIRRIYLCLAAVIVGAGAIAGIAAGQAALLYFAPQLSNFLPLTITAIWSWGSLGMALLLAFLISAIFILPPIMHYARANPLALFGGGARADDLPGLSMRERLIIGAFALLTIVVLPLEGEDKIIVVGVAATAALLFALSRLAAAAAGKLAAKTPPPLSWGLLAVSRNKRQAATSAISMGVGLAALAAIVNVEANFNAVVNSALRQEVPGLYMIGILPNQVEPLRASITKEDADATMRSVPIVRGRITHLAGKSVAGYDPPDDVDWILRGDRGMTWSEDGSFIGESSQLVAGTVWADDMEGKIQMSFDAEAAAAFGLQLGDSVRVNILGRPMTAYITSFRKIEWQRFNINFVMILSQKPFANVPHGFFAAAYIKEDAARRMQRIIGAQFPNVTPVVSGEVFDTAQVMLGRIAALLRAITLLLLAGAVPVVIATLAESHHRRLRDSVAMRLVGAPGKSITAAALTEMSCTALVCILPAVLFGMAAGWFVISTIFELPWVPRLADAAILITLATLFFLLLGGISILRIVRAPPFPMLRND